MHVMLYSISPPGTDLHLTRSTNLVDSDNHRLSVWNHGNPSSNSGHRSQIQVTGHNVRSQVTMGRRWECELLTFILAPQVYEVC